MFLYQVLSKKILIEDNLYKNIRKLINYFPFFLFLISMKPSESSLVSEKFTLLVLLHSSFNFDSTKNVLSELFCKQRFFISSV